METSQTRCRIHKNTWTIGPQPMKANICCLNLLPTLIFSLSKFVSAFTKREKERESPKCSVCTWHFFFCILSFLFFTHSCGFVPLPSVLSFLRSHSCGGGHHSLIRVFLHTCVTLLSFLSVCHFAHLKLTPVWK